MKISDFLAPDDTLVGVRATNKRQLLQDLSRKAADGVQLSADTILSELLKREELGSTGVGGGVAIPHTRLGAVTHPFGVLARLKQPIEFDAIDRQAVDLVFLLLLPASAEKEQLVPLALVARRLKAADVLTKMRGAKAAADLYAITTG
ncbi:PTS sugar transporter subunit IIA [Bradyrhizobium sp. U87765 SZCCT0131]|uniref:PTS sugar transporter subunit IIA n=1 Tax=unclassified Bradyrhizobium TaxID=2631580 RepID=UPI001BAAEC2C|nr:MULTISPECIES: PTS sugar transporter subunit IIA [unclassified Bradyrhizobium]MBR1222765.1 PTS sugar transporter subunit IIA [Bradyrhizobium sp. U87765 SZCCT0131]MBR1265154.1 PTS sugar transporter subunit IIA [Bradyrhizobium sp. U87765 SZCCT0134]MBR1303067.1 PTS sugar transporter subunit IIA [Bradyrhizobium sp. U87765 SZCCT0110]MBR1318673.1 PTS sugar transporter subunit IIA [Bradyrhizobium sp. U87765 SZCCT0109]MBR1346996.1 PTS sugar transporter subunit IIA [Bradyrhizobium sp. U87765 SZCCT004